MSGIFGIFNRNGKPVEKETVNTILDAMSFWEPDERNTWINESVALGHTMLWNTPESKYEHLPLIKETYVLTMDARIDNRDELLKELELPDRALDEIGDSEFILAAYQKWGEDCPKYLLGDFVFVLWDEKNKQFFCARDHVGIKPFYYYLDDEKFIFANDVRGVISHKNIEKKYNEKAIAIYLKVAGLLHPTFTMFKSVIKLQPATSLTIKSNNVKFKTYWKAEDSPKIDMASMDEYAKYLRKLLEDSIKVRLRSNYPLGSHLSGGLDSSVISVISARILSKNNKQLHSYNWVQSPKKYDDQEYYEWSNSQKLAKQEGIIHHHVDLDENDIFDIFNTLDISINDTTDLWYEFPLRKLAHRQNVRTMLSGWGGDELITYKGAGFYAEKFWKLKDLSVLHEFMQLSKQAAYPLKRFLGLCYRHIFLPILPDWFYCHMPYVKCDDLGCKRLIQPTFLSKMKFNFSYGASIPRLGVRGRQLGLFNFGHIVSRIESWSASSKKMEYRYPLLDKRIVEFALGIPSKCFFNKQIGRYLYRYAIFDILPDDIRWSTTKQEPVRVSRYLDISLKAHSLWLDKIKSNKVNLNDDIINISNLIELINGTNIESTKDLDKLIKISDGIGLAILVLGIDKEY